MPLSAMNSSPPPLCYLYQNLPKKKKKMPIKAGTYVHTPCQCENPLEPGQFVNFPIVTYDEIENSVESITNLNCYHHDLQIHLM